MMNVLFIGGAGFIGSSIIYELINAEENIEHIYVIEPVSADLYRLEGLPLHIIRGTIADIELIGNIIRKHHISKVIHLVSTLVPGCGYEEYKQEFENVIFPTMRLIQLCSKMDVQLIFFSSGGTVYGERKTREPFTESDPKEPISYYGLSKLMIENSILFENRTSNLRYLIIRPSNPYGHGQNTKGKQGLIAVSIGRILTGEPIKVWGDGSSVRDYIYIDDLAKVVSQLLKSNVTNTIVNIGSNKGYSIKEVIDILNDIVNEDVMVEYMPNRNNDVSNMILDTTLMNTLVDINLTPLEEGIAKFYRYEKERLMIDFSSTMDGLSKV